MAISVILILLPLVITCESSCDAGLKTCDSGKGHDSSSLLQKTLNVDNHLNQSQNGLLQVEKTVQSDKPLVLFTFLFGLSMEEPLMQLFIKSVANTPIDYVVIGDTSPVAPLPKNMRHVHITWQDMVDCLQSHFPGVDLQVIREANYKKVADLKPFSAMIVQGELDDFRRYKYWGYVDHDVWLGDTSILAGRLMERTEDVFFSLDPLPNHTWGPFQIYRNNAIMIEGLWEQQQNIEIAHHVLHTSDKLAFDEWGAQSSKGVNYSMTGIVRRSLDNAEITSASLRLVYTDEKDMTFMMWDKSCKTIDYPGCGFCEMRTPGIVSGQNLTVTRLFAMENEELFMCHFQHSKHGRWYKETHFDDMRDVLEAPVIYSTFADGVSTTDKARHEKPFQPDSLALYMKQFQLA